MPKLSIVVPCYNEQEALPLFYPAVEEAIQKISNLEIEYWLVDDGSADQTLEEMRKLHAMDPERVHYLTFQETLERRAPYMRDLKQRRVIMWW